MNDGFDHEKVIKGLVKGFYYTWMVIGMGVVAYNSFLIAEIMKMDLKLRMGLTATPWPF